MASTSKPKSSAMWAVVRIAFVVLLLVFIIGAFASTSGSIMITMEDLAMFLIQILMAFGIFGAAFILLWTMRDIEQFITTVKEIAVDGPTPTPAPAPALTDSKPAMEAVQEEPSADVPAAPSSETGPAADKEGSAKDPDEVPKPHRRRHQPGARGRDKRPDPAREAGTRTDTDGTAAAKPTAEKKVPVEV